jgi:hypothetical protein
MLFAVNSLVLAQGDRNLYKPAYKKKKNKTEKFQGDIKPKPQKMSANDIMGIYTGEVKQKNVPSKTKTKGTKSEGNLKANSDLAKKKSQNPTKSSSGDIKVSEKGMTAADVMGVYTGGLPIKFRNNAENKKKTNQGGKSTGDIVVKGDYKKKKTKGTDFGGNIKVSKNDAKKNLSNQLKDYSGDIVVKHKGITHNDVMHNYTGSFVKSKLPSKVTGKDITMSSGDIKVKNANYQMKSNPTAGYSGDISSKVMKNRQEIRKNLTKRMKSYDGNIKVSDLRKKQKRIRERTRNMMHYEGDIVVKKRRKGAHPSSFYRGGKLKAYDKKDKFRKKMIKKARKGNASDPEYMRKQERKPRFNADEGKIWYK